MDVLEIAHWVLTHIDELLMVVGGAAIIARWTPWQADNKAVDYVLKSLHWLAANKGLIKKIDSVKTDAAQPAEDASKAEGDDLQ